MQGAWLVQCASVAGWGVWAFCLAPDWASVAALAVCAVGMVATIAAVQGSSLGIGTLVQAVARLVPSFVAQPPRVCVLAPEERPVAVPPRQSHQLVAQAFVHHTLQPPRRFLTRYLSD